MPPRTVKKISGSTEQVDSTVTTKKVHYSRLSKELVVGEVYVSAFLEQSLHPHTRTNNTVRAISLVSVSIAHSRGRGVM